MAFSAPESTVAVEQTVVVQATRDGTYFALSALTEATLVFTDHLGATDSVSLTVNLGVASYQYSTTLAGVVSAQAFTDQGCLPALSHDSTAHSLVAFVILAMAAPVLLCGARC